MSQFIEVKTAELIGPALDWAMAVADDEEHPQVYNGVVYVNGPKKNALAMEYCPSTNWAQCGPILDNYDIALNGGVVDGEQVVIYATLRAVSDDSPFATATGLTRLIASCRAVVCYKLGDVVKVPIELVTTTTIIPDQ